MTLDPLLTEPTKLDDIPFLTVEKDGFLEVGWICAEKMGLEPWMHPLVLQIFGCAEVTIIHGKVVDCFILYSMDSILEHELKHCQGYRH